MLPRGCPGLHKCEVPTVLSNVPLSGVTQKTFAHTEFFSVLTRIGQSSGRGGCQGLVADRPFARGEIRDRHQRGKRNENSNSTFHVRPRRTDPGGPKAS
jgi:hypothetical protein